MRALYRCFAIGVVLLCFCSRGRAATNYAGVFGITNGPTVDSGFLFVQGEYVDAPYSFARTGTEIRVNGRLLSGPGAMQWPPVKYMDPGIPEGLTRKSTFRDLVYDADSPAGNYASHKFVTLSWSCTNDKELATKFAEWVASLPFVATATTRVSVVGEQVVHAKSIHGEEWARRIPYGAAARASGPVDEDVARKNMVRTLDQEMMQYAADLNLGSALFLDVGGRRSYPDRKTVADLPTAVKILRSDTPELAKWQAMQKLAFVSSVSTNPSPEELRVVTGFKASSQLEERLTKLAEKLGVRTGTANDAGGGPRKPVEERKSARKLMLYVGTGPGGSVSLPQVTWYTNGAPITVEATPSNGWRFAKWMGDVGSGVDVRNPVELIMDRRRTVTALFEATEKPK